MEYVRAVHWWALMALLLGMVAIAIAVIYPDRGVLALVVAIVSLAFAVLSLREGVEENR
jgi:hypothetical protein